MRSYIRKTALDSVRSLLKNLPEHKDHPRDAIRMIDREIGGLLAHMESPFYNAYRDVAGILFPSGLEATAPGKDIILVLNSKEALIKNNGREAMVKIPTALKQPEKGVAQIIGQHFARTLFMVRGRILNHLMNAEEEKDQNWQVNATANDQALAVLENYIPYPSFFDMRPPAKPSLLEQFFPCFSGR